MKNHPQKELKRHLRHNLILLGISVILAVFLARSGFFENLVNQVQGIALIGSFLAGFFFTSVLTVGPATIVLGEIAQVSSPFLVALIGAAGSVLGDLILFRFVKEEITDDFIALFRQKRFMHLKAFFKLGWFRWLLPVIGALVVASPLPDEIGLAMLGISQIPISIFLPLAYAMNFIGIFLISLAALII